MVDFKMPVTAKHQRVIAFEFIGIDDRSTPDGFRGEVQKRSGLDILHDRYFDNPVSLQDTENRDFAGSFPTSFTFAPASKTGLVKFDSALEE